MNIQNLSALLGNSNKTDATAEAKKNITNTLFRSHGTNDGWGKMETFLLSLFGLFSSRCRDVGTALKAANECINAMKNINDASNETGATADVVNLYLTSQIYHHLGANMHFLVDVNGAEPKVILSGQPVDDSNVLWKPGELDYEMPVSYDGIAVLKLLSGDPDLIIPVIPGASRSEVATSTLIDKCFDPSGMSRAQEAFVRSLLSMPAESARGIVLGWSCVKDTLHGASEQIAAHLNDTSVTTGLFYDMYLHDGHTDRLTSKDIEAALVKWCLTVEHMGRVRALDQVEKELSVYLSQLDTKIGEKQGDINTFICKAADELKNIINRLETDLQERLNGGSLPSDLQKGIRNCLKKCDKCRESTSTGDLANAIKSVSNAIESVSGLQNNAMKSMEVLYTREQKTIQSRIQKLQKQSENNAQELAQLLRNKEDKSNLLTGAKNREQELCRNKEQEEKTITDLKAKKESCLERLSEVSQQGDFVQELLDSLKNDESELRKKQELKISEEKETKNEWGRQCVSIFREMKKQYVDQNNLQEMRDIADKVIDAAENNTFTKRSYETLKDNDENLTRDDMPLYEKVLKEKNLSRDLAFKIADFFAKRYKCSEVENNPVEWMKNNGFIEATEVNRPSMLNEFTLNEEVSRFFVNKEVIRDWVEKYYSTNTQKRRGFLGKKNTKEAATSSNVDAEFDNLCTKLETYCRAHNAYISDIESLRGIYAQKCQLAKMLFDTVKNIKQNLVPSIENFVQQNVAAKADVNGFLSTLKDEALFDEIQDFLRHDDVSELTGFMSKVEHLASVTLPKLVKVRKDKTEDHMDGFNFTLKQMNCSLDTQDEENIKWILTYIKDNFIETVALNQARNKAAFTEQINRCTNEIQQKRALLKNITDEYIFSKDSFKAEIENIGEQLEKNHLLQEEHIREQNQLVTQASVLYGELESITSGIDQTTENLRKTKQSISEIKAKINKYQADVEKVTKAVEQKQKDLRANTDKLEEQEKIQKATQQQHESRTAISVAMNADIVNRTEIKDIFEKKTAELKNLQDAQCFQMAVKTNIPLLDYWKSTGHMLNGEKEGEFNSVLINNGRLSNNIDVEAVITLWKDHFYDKGNGEKRIQLRGEDFDKYDVLSSLNEIDGAKRIIEDVQHETFNRLFGNKENALINDVHCGLVKYCNLHELSVNFDSFQRYVGYLYSEYKHLESLPDGEYKDALLKNKTEELYKAQLLYGIWTDSTQVDPRVKTVIEAQRGVNWVEKTSDSLMRFAYEISDHGVSHNEVRMPFQWNGAEFMPLFEQWQRDHRGANYEPIKLLLLNLHAQCNRTATEMISGRIMKFKLEEFTTPTFSKFITERRGRANLPYMQSLFNITDMAGGGSMVYTSGEVSYFNKAYEAFVAKRNDWILGQTNLKEEVVKICNDMR